MRWGCIKAALLMGFAVATAGAASAQQRQLPPAQPSIMNEEEDTPPPSSQSQPANPARGRADTAAPTLETDPNLDQADQLAPSQIRQPIPAAVAEPTGKRPARSVARGTEAMVEPGMSERSSLPAKQYTVVCRGVFGKDSNQVKLAMAFQSRNVALMQVDSASGSKVMASVLFAKDPKRRLEVWWSNATNRTDTHLIVINGQSDWSAPGQLRLGLTLPQLEQLNGKPFKLSGFDKNNVATLTTWNGGGLAAVAGGCTVGISLRAALTAPASALSALPADREFTSADAALRAVNPMVSEILVAY